MSNQEGISLLERPSRGNLPETNRLRDCSSSDEWEEGSSSCSSSCFSGTCSDDSYIANWENYVMPDGSLFYAEYSSSGPSRLPGSGNESALQVIRNDFNRASTRRSGKKKFSNFVGRGGDARGIVQQITQQQRISENPGTSSNEDANVEIKEIEVTINPENRFKFGRRASLTEAFLGISTATSPDGIRLKVTGLMVDSNFVLEKHVKVGDWLKSINGVDVTVNNINDLLSHYNKTTKAVVKFHRTPDKEQAVNTTTTCQVTNFETFTKSAVKLLSHDSSNNELNTSSNSCSFSLMILAMDSIESDAEDNDVIFSYPCKVDNELYGVRGSFLTINSILKSELKAEPLSTTFRIKESEWNLCYYSCNKVLILFGILLKYASLKETKFRMDELVQYIKFTFDVIDFNPSPSGLTELQYICQILDVRIKQCQGHVTFETVLQESRLVSLPKEAQLRIFDAMSEMEAMDFRDWNEEPLNSHREFFMFGSALFFKSYLLASILPVTQLLGVQSFMKCRGIFDFIETHLVRDLVVWTEIPMPTSSTRYFLAISSRNQLTLAVILQAFEAERRISDEGVLEEKIIGPSLFYIEEIQDTLDHLRHGGIEALARVWVTSNKRPEVCNEHDENQGKLSKKKTDTVSTSKLTSGLPDDVKMNSSMGGSSIQSLTHSEDSNKKLEDCDSDSDWDGFPDSHKSSSGFDMSEMKDSFLKEISDVTPTRITAGKENVLIHYIHLDIGMGIILSSPEVQFSPLIDKFNVACHLIHTVLQNTKKFRRLLSQESSKPNSHKSLVAIKEHGVLVSLQRELGSEINFWVIGRLFTSPTRELYICHKSDVPQNLVEIAFRLSFITSG